MFKKNTAVVGFAIGNFINASTGATVTTGTPVEKRLIDGTGADLTNAATYNTAAAQWEIDLTAADMNGDVIGLSFSLTGCIPISYTIKTVLGLPQSTIAASGDEMDLTDAPNSTAVTAIQSGLAPASEYDTEMARITANVATEAKQDIIDTNVDSILEDTGTTLQGEIDAIQAAVITNASGADIAADIIAVKAETANILTDTGTTLAAHLTDIKGTGFVKDTHSQPQCLTGAGGSAPTVVEIADAVWDEALSGHTDAGSSGLALSTASSGGVDPSVLADAIWDEAISGHTTAGTFGAKNQKVVPSETTGDYKASGFSTHNAADVKTAIEAAGSHLAAIKTITDALTAAAAAKLALSAGTIVAGTVSHDNTAATTTVFYSDDIAEATTDHYNGRIIIFTSGALQYQATSISGYELAAGEGKFTVVALTEAPADNATFIIV